MRIRLVWWAVAWGVGCGIGVRAPPTVEGPTPQASPSPTADVDASGVAVGGGEPDATPDAPRAGNPGRLWCHERGLVRLNPCPGGGQTDGGPIPEDGLFCCETGDPDPYPCMMSLVAARDCGDPAGIAAAERRIEEGVRAHGDPCLDQGFRDTLFRFASFRRICAERGHSPTEADAPQLCHVTDVSCPPSWRTLTQ